MRLDPIRLYWWQRSDMVNLGDELNRFIVEFVSDRSVVQTGHDEADMLAIGSVLNFPDAQAAASRKSPWLVWGSGTLSSQIRTRSEMFHCSALRGPLTLSLVGEGHRPVPLGDPGILTSALWPAPSAKKHRWGIVPHYAHRQQPWVARALEKTPGAVLVDVRDPDVKKVCRLMASCEYIASTSLHGLVIADSYGVPNIWLSQGGVNETWKYWDYFAGIGRYGVTAVPVDRIGNLVEREDKIDSQTYQGLIPAAMKRLVVAFPI